VLLRRLAVLGVIAVAMTVLGVMTIGLAETVKYGVIGLAAAGVLLLLMRVIGGRSAATPATPPAKSSKPGQGPPAK
jgi:hypothetical protein